MSKVAATNERKFIHSETGKKYNSLSLSCDEDDANSSDELTATHATSNRTKKQIPNSHHIAKLAKICPHRRFSLALHTFHFFVRSLARLRFITDLICNFFRISMFLWCERSDSSRCQWQTDGVKHVECHVCLASHTSHIRHMSPTRAPNGTNTHSSKAKLSRPSRDISFYLFSLSFFFMCTIAIDSKRVKLTNCNF